MTLDPQNSLALTNCYVVSLTDNRQHEQGPRLSEDRLIAVAHIDKKAFLGTPMATMMLLMDAELPGRMCKIQGEYIQEVIAVTPAPHTHTYKLVMTSVGARNEVMDRVDMIGRGVFAKFGLVVTKWTWK
jgi:hypothetical protein